VIVGIHQPNFFPWIGFFDKIQKSSVFVFLDDVAMPRSGRGCWQNRVKLLINGTPRWVTCPLVRNDGGKTIQHARIDDGRPWRRKFLKTLSHQYSKAPHFRSVMDFVEPMVMRQEEKLADFNITNILDFCSIIDTEPKSIRQSDLHTENASTELLLEIVRKVGGHAYLSGNGASGYQNNVRFSQEGFHLIFQDFNHPKYDQGRNGFFPGLSIIDAMMWALDEIRVFFSK